MWGERHLDQKGKDENTTKACETFNYGHIQEIYFNYKTFCNQTFNPSCNWAPEQKQQLSAECTEQLFCQGVFLPHNLFLDSGFKITNTIQHVWPIKVSLLIYALWKQILMMFRFTQVVFICFHYHMVGNVLQRAYHFFNVTQAQQ